MSSFDLNKLASSVRKASSNFAKTAARATQQVLISTGAVEFEDDAQFVSLVNRFHQLDKYVNVIFEDVQQFINQMTLVYPATQSIASTFSEAFESSSRPHPLKAAADAFVNVQSQLDDDVIRGLQVYINDRVLDPLSRQHEKNSDLHHGLERRHKALLDLQIYDRKLHGMSQDNPHFAHTLEKKEQLVQHISSTSRELSDRLIQTNKERQRLLCNCFFSLSLAQTRFNALAARRCNEFLESAGPTFAEILRLSDEDRDMLRGFCRLPSGDEPPLQRPPRPPSSSAASPRGSLSPRATSPHRRTASDSYPSRTPPTTTPHQTPPSSRPQSPPPQNSGSESPRSLSPPPSSSRTRARSPARHRSAPAQAPVQPNATSPSATAQAQSGVADLLGLGLDDSASPPSASPPSSAESRPPAPASAAPASVPNGRARPSTSSVASVSSIEDFVSTGGASSSTPPGRSQLGPSPTLHAPQPQPHAHSATVPQHTQPQPRPHRTGSDNDIADFFGSSGGSAGSRGPAGGSVQHDLLATGEHRSFSPKQDETNGVIKDDLDYDRLDKERAARLRNQEEAPEIREQLKKKREEAIKVAQEERRQQMKQQDEQNKMETMEKDMVENMVNQEIESWAGGQRDNIRALLSTMDRVLWPGSGWKPVGMASLVQAAKVKLHYRKAIMVCHPDKTLNFSVEQKLIAEKVFDTLQTAWTSFEAMELKGGNSPMPHGMSSPMGGMGNMGNMAGRGGMQNPMG
eukprot:Rmarinus@m.22704